MVQLGLDLGQELGAIAVERVDLLELAQRANRLELPAGAQVRDRLIVQLGLVIALLRRRAWAGRARAALGRLPTVIGIPRREIAQNGVGLGQALATFTGIRLIVGWCIDEAIGVKFRNFSPVGAFDLVERCRA